MSIDDIIESHEREIIKLKQKLVKAKADLAEAREDVARLDTLIKIIAENPGGLLLHQQVCDVEWTGVGLGMSHRSLRQAIDDYNGAAIDAARAGGGR